MEQLHLNLWYGKTIQFLIETWLMSPTSQIIEYTRNVEKILTNSDILKHKSVDPNLDEKTCLDQPGILYNNSFLVVQKSKC